MDVRERLTKYCRCDTCVLRYCAKSEDAEDSGSCAPKGCNMAVECYIVVLIQLLDELV